MVAPLILAGIGAGLGLTSGLFGLGSSKKKSKAVKEQAMFAAGERQRQGEKLVSSQKVSALKSGVELEGSVLDIINETKAFTAADVSSILRTGSVQAKNIRTQAKVNLAKSIMSGATSGFKMGM